MIRNLIGGNFFEGAHGREGYGNASESKETLYISTVSVLSKKQLKTLYFCFEF